MIVKVDGVQSLTELEIIASTNGELITLSLTNPFEPIYYLDFRIFDNLPRVNGNLRFGISYNPHYDSITTCAKAIDSGKIDYVQIAYSQLLHPQCIELRDSYRSYSNFVCDGIIADSDSEPDWVTQAIEDSLEWGCNLTILDIFYDRERGWKDFTTGDFELKLGDLKGWLTKYNVGISCDFHIEDTEYIKNLHDKLVVNLKLNHSNLYGHYHQLDDVLKLMKEYDLTRTQRT